MLTAEQFALVNRSTAPWLTLWLIADFEAGRAHAVSSMAGGTYTFADGGRGLYETGGKGMSAWRGDRSAPEVSATWGEVKRWRDAIPASTRDEAAALQKAGHELQRAYPNPYPGIGRAYCWDARDDRHTTDPCAQCERDRADLDAANARRAAEVEAWQVTRAEHDARVKAFLASLEPSREFDLLALMAGA